MPRDGKAPPRSQARTADLFAHFGVPLTTLAEAPAIVFAEASPCPRCGWFQTGPRCSLCGPAVAPESAP